MLSWIELEQKTCKLLIIHSCKPANVFKALFFFAGTRLNIGLIIIISPSMMHETKTTFSYSCFMKIFIAVPQSKNKYQNKYKKERIFFKGQWKLRKKYVIKTITK